MSQTYQSFSPTIEQSELEFLADYECLAKRHRSAPAKAQVQTDPANRHGTGLSKKNQNIDQILGMVGQSICS